MPAQKKAQDIVITAPNMQVVELRIRGTVPYVQNKFSKKALEQMKETQQAGSTATAKKRKREAKDFDAVYEAAKHVSREGWLGIPAPAFRSAMIDACRLVGFTMTRAKLAVFVVADGFDFEDGTPLVKIEGEPEMKIAPVRNATGVVDIRVRPMWEEWTATLRIQFDADQFTPSDVTNLILRAGAQVGIGEGRPNSKSSHGCGWGMFEIVTEDAA